MSKKRLIITSTISILLVAILMIKSTYSIFTTSDIDETTNVYTTGNLNVTYTLSSSNISLIDAVPTSNEDSIFIKPYRITVSNSGTVPYQFNIILTDTTASNVIDYQYIMTQVGKLEPKALNDCENNVIKENVIVPANSSVDIDIRVWISDKVQNSEMGKSFYAKLAIDGLAIYDRNNDIDNSILIADYETLLSEVEPGSYVSYIGNNGCDAHTGECIGRNANYVSSTDMGYCDSSTYKFTVNGWRVAYVKDKSVYLISAGATECLATNSSGVVSSEKINATEKEATAGVPLHLNNLNAIALKYCNDIYAQNERCDSSTARSINAEDFKQITGGELSSVSCFMDTSDACGQSNTLINNGGYYWYAKSYDVDNPNWTYNKFDTALVWNPQYNAISNYDTYYSSGVRPVLKLDPNVYVVGGNGTLTDPYRIATTKVKISDLSINENHGINRGTIWDKSAGIVTTDGKTSYIDAGLAKYDFKNSITIVARVKFLELSDGVTSEYLGNWEEAGGGLGIYSGKFGFMLYIDGKYRYFYSTTTPVVDTWYTVVATYNGSRLALYINGKELLTDTSISSNATSVTGNISISSLPFYIGGNPNINGTLDSTMKVSFENILIFDRALSVNEIASNYSDVPNPMDRSNLLLYYDFK